MKTCINFGVSCIGCHIYYCIDDRRCTGECNNCKDNSCDNHPQRAEIYDYAEELCA